MRARTFLFLFFFYLGVSSVSAFNVSDNPAIKKDISPAYSSYLKGLLSDRYGDSQRALDEYIRARKFDQQSSSLKLRIAVQYIKLDDLDKAINILQEIKGQEPINLDAYLLLILLYSQKGAEDKANIEYEDMLSRLYEEKPDNLKIAQSLAQFKFQKHDYEAALAIYENILKLNPDNIDIHFWMGYLYEESGQRDKAVEVWKKALALEPDHPDVLNSLGYVYAEEGINLDEAEALVKRALVIKPDSAAYLDSLGWVYFKKKDFQSAKEYIEKAVVFLKDPVILDHLADVYLSLGDLSRAKELWNEALEIDPENEIIQEKVKSVSNETVAREK
ncbi:MAG: tetratricopeptide repeat protein [Candidatus Omnitrophica bacterium]|nr:tetratricopeptide repeat protein [Candidatus Omnitrophota bacterium]